MFNINDLKELVTKDLATKIIAELDDQQKMDIISLGVKEVVERVATDIGYEVRKIVEEQGMKFAAEYVLEPDIQEKIKIEARQAVDEVMKNVIDIIGKKLDSTIKSEYNKLYEGKGK